MSNDRTTDDRFLIGYELAMREMCDVLSRLRDEMPVRARRPIALCLAETRKKADEVARARS